MNHWLTSRECDALIANVGLPRACRFVESGNEQLAVEQLTAEHSLAGLDRRASLDTPLPLEEDPRETGVRLRHQTRPEHYWLSGLADRAVRRMDFLRVRVDRASRFVLLSPGARRGLEPPFRYLRDLKTPAEIAQHICAESRRRGGEPAEDASAIVIDIDPKRDGSGT